MTSKSTYRSLSVQRLSEHTVVIRANIRICTGQICFIRMMYSILPSALHPSVTRKSIIWHWINKYTFLFPWLSSTCRQRRLHYRGLTFTLRHTTLGRTTLDEWSARHWTHYLSTHNTHNRQISVPPVGCELVILSCKLVAQAPRPTPRGHWDPHKFMLVQKKWILRTKDQNIVNYSVTFVGSIPNYKFFFFTFSQ
jgi:hypothetical protein